VSIQDLRPDPQDNSSFYLENIFQLLADTNASSTSTPSTAATKPPPFSPPRYAIWVNSLWFLSLVISLTSALLATLIQQWTRRYFKATQPQNSPDKRARIHRLLSSGVDDLYFLLATDVVPILLHLSVFLFIAGLLILLRNTNHTVFDVVLVWVALCVAIYAYITFLPIFRPASPNYGPISSLAWQLYAAGSNHVFQLLSIWKGSRNKDPLLPARLLRRLEEKAEEIILGKSPELDARILESLLDNLCGDRAQETFFEAIPGFFNSQRVVQMQNVKKRLSSMFYTKFRRSVDQFLDKTLSSDYVSELGRSCRLLTCLKAAHIVLGDRAGMSIADRIIHNGNWNEVDPSPEMGNSLRRWRNSNDPLIAPIGSCIIAQIIARVGMHDYTWMALTMSQLGVTDEVLQGYLNHGDSVLLANLINTTRLFFENGLQFQDILRPISRFNVHDTLPDLQRDFCILWNEIVRRVQDMQESGSLSDLVFILQEIQPVYDAIHSTARAVATTPTSTAANNDYLHLGFSYSSCADPQSHLSPTAAYSIDLPQPSPSRRPPPPPFEPEILISRVSRRPAAPAWFPPEIQSPPAPWDSLGELPAEAHSHMPPAPDPSHSMTTTHTFAIPREASDSDTSSPRISASIPGATHTPRIVEETGPEPIQVYPPPQRTRYEAAPYSPPVPFVPWESSDSLGEHPGEVHSHTPPAL